MIGKPSRPYFDEQHDPTSQHTRGPSPICSHVRCRDAAPELCLVGCGAICPTHGTPCTEHIGDKLAPNCYAYCPTGAHSWVPADWDRSAFLCGCTTCVAYLVSRKFTTDRIEKAKRLFSERQNTPLHAPRSFRV